MPEQSQNSTVYHFVATLRNDSNATFNKLPQIYLVLVNRLIFNKNLLHYVRKNMGIKPNWILFHIFGYLVIVLLGTTSNISSINGDFVFDDTEVLINNKDILPSTPVQNIFQNDYWGTNLKLNHSHKSYRPLTVLSFRWNYILLGGLHPWGFHFVNIVLHAIISVLTWPVFHTILGKNKIFIAFLASVLFSVHPIHTEAVSGVVGRADLLSALFFLLSFLTFSRSSMKGSKEWFWISFSIILAAVSMFCKEQGITVIGILCLYDVLYLNKINISNPQKILSKILNYGKNKFYLWQLLKHQCILLTSGLFLILFRYYLMDFQGPKFQKVDNPASFENNWITRTLTYNYIFSLNVWLLLCPEWLCFDWSMGCIPVVTAKDLRIFFIFIFWFTFFFIIWKGLFIKNIERQRCIFTALSIMVLPFLPASNLFFTVGFVIAERVLYIPSIGFCLLVVCGIEVLIKNFPMNKNDLTFGFSLLVIVFLIRSYERSSDWKSEEVLFNAGASVCPLNAKVHYNIAKNAVDLGNVEKAIDEYREAIRLLPDYDQALNNLANILKSKGNLQEAEVLLRRALDIRKEFPAAWMNLGIVLTQRGRFLDAEKCYANALKYRKNYPDCYYNLGNMYLAQKRKKEAEKAWKAALKLKPTFSIAWNNLILLHDNSGDLNKAVSLATQALSHLPNDSGIHFNLANALGKSGEFQKSESHFLVALKLSPNNPQYHVNLGVLYHRWKKYRHALECYLKALKINPNFKSAKDNYESLKKKMIT